MEAVSLDIWLQKADFILNCEEKLTEWRDEALRVIFRKDIQKWSTILGNDKHRSLIFEWCEVYGLADDDDSEDDDDGDDPAKKQQMYEEDEEDQKEEEKKPNVRKEKLQYRELHLQTTFNRDFDNFINTNLGLSRIEQRNKLLEELRKLDELEQSLNILSLQTKT